MYLCYDFMEFFHREPADFNQLAEYLRYRKARDTIRSIEADLARAMSE